MEGLAVRKKQLGSPILGENKKKGPPPKIPERGYPKNRLLLVLNGASNLSRQPSGYLLKKYGL
jgi:hypothetical protein